MAFSNGPVVVRDGLVLSLDAADKNSYPGNGTAWFDTSGNNNNGTLTNGPNFNSSNGGSIVFDGTDDVVSISNASSLNISSQITLEAWIYTTKPSGTQNVICKSSITQNTGYIYPRTDNGWADTVFYLYIGGWQTLSATWPGLNNWYHTAGTYNGSTMIIYINGVQATSKSQSGTITTNTNTLALGDQPGYSEFYGGRTACARVYNRALSASEILQNYNATKSRFNLK